MPETFRFDIPMSNKYYSIQFSARSFQIMSALMLWQSRQSTNLIRLQTIWHSTQLCAHKFLSTKSGRVNMCLALQSPVDYTVMLCQQIRHRVWPGSIGPDWMIWQASKVFTAPLGRVCAARVRTLRALRTRSRKAFSPLPSVYERSNLTLLTWILASCWGFNSPFSWNSAACSKWSCFRLNCDLNNSITSQS